MPHVCWALQRGRPIIRITLAMPGTTQTAIRTLVADTGGGSLNAPFEIVLSEVDCRQFQKRLAGMAKLGGAFSGGFLTYLVWVEIPGLYFAQYVAAVAIPAAQLPQGFDGIAAFRFLNSFNYGNFGDPDQFCLETL